MTDLMDDTHRGKVVNEYIQAMTVQWIDWPALSPNLNAIENAWTINQRHISTRQAQLTNLQAQLTNLHQLADPLNLLYGSY